MTNLTETEYLCDPCGASALTLRKARRVRVSENMLIQREDEYDPAALRGYSDEPYFKAIRRLPANERPCVPEGFRLIYPDPETLRAHIRECYGGGPAGNDPEFSRLFSAENEGLAVALADEKDGRVAASGIADFDPSVGEGSLEWIQVSPEYRRRGLGAAVVGELLWTLFSRRNARFVTVSGRLESISRPLELYRKCGFGGTVIWHVLTKTER